MKVARHRPADSRGPSGPAASRPAKPVTKFLLAAVRGAGPEHVPVPGAAGQFQRPGPRNGAAHRHRARRRAGADVDSGTGRRPPVTSVPRSAASSPGRSPAPMPNTTMASAEARFAGPRCARATAASSARSPGEYGGRRLRPGKRRRPAARRAVHRGGQLIQHRAVGAPGRGRPAPARPATQNASITS